MSPDATVYSHTSRHSTCRVADATAKLEQQRAAALEAVLAVMAVQHSRPPSKPQPQPPSCRMVADIAIMLGSCLTPTARSLQAAAPEQPPALALASTSTALRCCCLIAQVRTPGLQALGGSLLSPYAYTQLMRCPFMLWAVVLPSARGISRVRKDAALQVKGQLGPGLTCCNLVHASMVYAGSSTLYSPEPGSMLQALLLAVQAMTMGQPDLEDMPVADINARFQLAAVCLELTRCTLSLPFACPCQVALLTSWAELLQLRVWTSVQAGAHYDGLCRGWLEVWLTSPAGAEPEQERLTETLLACLLQLIHFVGDTGHHPARQQRAWHTQQVRSPWGCVRRSLLHDAGCVSTPDITSFGLWLQSCSFDC